MQDARGHDLQRGGGTCREELLAADRAFAAEIAAADPSRRGEVWAGWFAATGRQILPGRVVAGRDAITALMDPVFRTPGTTLTWEPDTAEASADGSFGWTSGRYTSTGRGPDGDIVETGRYVSIWRRNVAGDWRLTADTGVPDPDADTP